MLHLGGLSIPRLSTAYGRSDRSVATEASRDAKGVTVRKEEAPLRTASPKNRPAKGFVTQPPWEPPPNNVGVGTESHPRQPGGRCPDVA